MKRRMLPLSALRAFEVVARRGSIKQAADEMGVTDGAISRQVRELEAFLGGPLFARSGRGLLPTDTGAELSAKLSHALDLIDTALDEARAELAREPSFARDGVSQVRVRAVSTFAARILLPKIGDFERDHPGVDLILTVSDWADEDALSEHELVLCYTRDLMPRRGSVVLLRDEAEPVAAPRLLARLRGIETPAQLMSRARLLGATSTSWDWQAWAGAHGVAWSPEQTTMRFDTDDLAIQAAVAGAGVVLADVRLAAIELREGRLVRVFPQARPVPLGTFVAFRRASISAAATAFLSWLQEILAAPPAPLTPAPSSPAASAPSPGSAPAPPGPPAP
jgi:LysR family glycine cleavage system transcriptional activator